MNIPLILIERLNAGLYIIISVFCAVDQISGGQRSPEIESPPALRSHMSHELIFFFVDFHLIKGDRISLPSPSNDFINRYQPIFSDETQTRNDEKYSAFISNAIDNNVTYLPYSDAIKKKKKSSVHCIAQSNTYLSVEK